MKLLGWMHRKLRQNSADGLKDNPTGSTCNCLSGGPSLNDHHQLSPVIPERTQGRALRDRTLSGDETLLFECLLSIGTLGSSPIEEEYEHETKQNETEQQEEEEGEHQESAAAMLEVIAEKEETEAAMEAELIAINAELEKALSEAADKEVDSRFSSARPSHVSTGRASDSCPLQEFLFRSVVEVEKEKKRASLGELFMIEEGDGDKKNKKNRKKEEDVDDENGGKNGLTKRLLKRRGSLGSSLRSDNGGGHGGVADAKEGAAAAKNAKFQKILQIFHKKIYPENGSGSKKPAAKPGRCKSYCATSCMTGSNHSVDGAGEYLMTPCRKGNKLGLDQPSRSLDRDSSTSSREHWIKTDAEYLVLEL